MRISPHAGWVEWTSPSLKEASSWRTTPSSFPTMACTLSIVRHRSTSSASQVRKIMTVSSHIWATAFGGHLSHHRPKINDICSVQSNPCAKPKQTSRWMEMSTIPFTLVPSFSFIRGTNCQQRPTILLTSVNTVPKPFLGCLSCEFIKDTCWPNVKTNCFMVKHQHCISQGGLWKLITGGMWN